jgi:hypothetical protein
MNKKINNFYLEGYVSDSGDAARLRSKFEDSVIETMRSNGYVPHLDLDPSFSIEYIEKEERFKFTLILYGIYLGKKRAREIYGAAGTKMLPLHQAK